MSPRLRRAVVRFPVGVVGALFLLSACASDEAAKTGSSSAEPAAPAVPEAAPAADETPEDEAAAAAASGVDEEGRSTLASGAAVPVPPKWTRSRDGADLVLTGPEGDVSVRVMERKAPTAEEALAEVTKRAIPDLEAKDKQVLAPPASDGFEQVLIHTWQLDGGQKIVQLIGFRKGEQVWTFLVEGTLAGVGRRGAQVREIVGGLKAPGVVEESLAGRDVQPLDAAKAAELKAFLVEAREAIGVPGAAVVVVQDGKPVFAEGFGQVAIDDKKPVTPDTLMMIGSITKSMSTLLMGTLVDEGKLAWDQKVKEVDPSFAMADAAVTEQLEMKHLVCACTGVPRRDFELLFDFEKKTPETLMADMATFPTTTGFGETFQYSNQMVAAGGFLAGKVANPKLPLGKAYDQAMKERVFGPMGLKTATLDFADLRKKPHAMPHSRDLAGQWQKLPLDLEKFVLPLRPSGGVWMSTGDLARYVSTEMARGVSPDGTRVASEASVVERWKPQVKASADGYYGLGWGTGTDRGLKVVSHSGGTFGFNALALFLPEQKLGMAAIVNGSGGHTWNLVAWERVLELLLGAEESAAKTLAFQLDARDKAVAKANEGLRDATAEEAKALAGKWKAPRLGEITISSKQGVVVDAGEWSSSASIKEEDGKKFLVLTGPPVGGLSFRMEAETLVLSEAQEDHVFERTGAKAKKRASAG